MPRKYLKKWLPNHEHIEKNRWLRPFAGRLRHPGLWHLHRRPVAGGFAIGLMCGLLPAPFQMISAALLAVTFRANFPVAVLATLYTNPLTFAPLYMLAYRLGAWVTDAGMSPSGAPVTPADIQWDKGIGGLLDWLVSLGKPLAIGLPLMGILFAVIGYLAVRLSWYAIVVWKWRRRPASRRGS